jgi:hypothetical protein
MVQLATTNTVLQLLAPEELRGRIVSVYVLAFMGLAPLGALLTGLAARAIGAPATVGLGGLAALATALWFGAAARRVFAATHERTARTPAPA